MPQRTEKRRQKRANKPSFDYQLEQDDVDEDDDEDDDDAEEDYSRSTRTVVDNRSEAESQKPSSLDVSDLEARRKAESDPYYQVYHKPAVRHPSILLLMCILTLLVSITLIVLDAFILSEEQRQSYLGTGVWAGSIGLVVSGVGMVFLHLQNNFFAIVVLNLDTVGFCINAFCGFHSVISVVLEPDKNASVRAKQIGIATLCLLYMCLILFHFVLMSMATCTRYKRKAAERSSMKDVKEP